MTRIIYFALLLCVIFTIKSAINCENDNSDIVQNSRMTKIIERHSENYRQWLCRGDGITTEQWANIKSECINPRINQLVPENAINIWQECSEKVDNVCDDQQWSGGKDCAKDMLSNEDIGEMQMWYKTRIRQMTTNFQTIKTCYLQQRQTA